MVIEVTNINGKAINVKSGCFTVSRFKEGEYMIYKNGTKQLAKLSPEMIEARRRLDVELDRQI